MILSSALTLFGILTPLENVMKSILDFFHSSVGLPWAWSIVALTIVVRIALVPLTVRQIHSMQSLQAHAPEMKEIQRKYKGDRQKLNEELMKFYKENHINPAASCLPLLAQFPVFIALYFALKNNTKDITGTFLGIVHLDKHVTNHWSGYLLLVIYGGSQIASTYFMGSTMDKTQRRIMMFLPIIFITFVARFPTGLVLYWMTTNLWTVGQGLVTRQLVPKPAAAAAVAPAGPKRSSRTPAKAEPQAAQGNGAAESERPPPATPQQPRRVKRKKKGGARR
jgi:YidC/Oxa1 family membrane protein insertase